MISRLISLFLLAAVWAAYSAIPTADTVTNSIGMKFKRIPAGTFQMGNEGVLLTGSTVYSGCSLGVYNEFPRHTVTLTHDFYMGIYEVTNAQFKRFRPNHGWDNIWYKADSGIPVNELSWAGADSFCAWLTEQDPNGWTYRLPTEAEWEYCCRAGTSTVFYTGDTLNSAQANIVNQWGSTPQLKVGGSYPPNPWGLHDMYGNAMEWCLDWLGLYTAQAKTNPCGPEEGGQKVIRSMGDYSFFCRTVARGSVPRSYHQYGRLGFRAVISDLTYDSLVHYPGADTLLPYQRRVAATRPAPATPVTGESYTDADGLAFTRVRMTRACNLTQKDSVVYVSFSPISNDSARTRALAGLYARRLSETYRVLYRLSNRYELFCANIAPDAGRYHLTIVPDISFEAGQGHPDVSHYVWRKLPVVNTTAGIAGPLNWDVNHYASIGECPNGDILTAWSSAVGEGGPDQTVAVSRLRNGESAFDSVTSLLWDFSSLWDGNGVFWDNGKGRLFNLVGSHILGTFLRYSDDNGVSWSEAHYQYSGNAGKSRVRLGGDTVVGFTEESGPDMLVMSVDGGMSYQKTGNLCRGGYHTSTVVDDSGLIMTYRRGMEIANDSGVNTMGMAETPDVGMTWVKKPTPFYPPTIGQFDIVIKLSSGRFLMATVSHAPGDNKVVLAESEDQGKTWFCRRKLGSTMGVDFMSGYKDMCQGRDGLIHLTGTYGSGTGNGDNPVISFSEQWLREGSCLDVQEWGRNTTGMVADGCPDDDSMPPLDIGAAASVGASLVGAPTLTAAPNPFNPSTAVHYAFSGNGTLSIHAIDGRLVRSFALKGGKGVAQWDGKDAQGRALASGLYVLRLKAGKNVLERKVLLAR